MKPELKQRYDKFMREIDDWDKKDELNISISTYAVYYLSSTEMPPERALETFLDYVSVRLEAEGY